jgi:YesN/AraC family two-component response regulator
LFVFIAFTLSSNGGILVFQTYAEYPTPAMKGNFSMKILVVDDDRIARMKLKRWLQALNCEVIEASDGNEGIDRYRDHRPDLVITDIIMPQKDGIQMMIEIQREYPDLNIFVISGAGDKEPGEYLAQVQNIGVLRTFVKPIDKDDLLAAVVDAFPETKPA